MVVVVVVKISTTAANAKDLALKSGVLDPLLIYRFRLVVTATILDSTGQVRSEPAFALEPTFADISISAELPPRPGSCEVSPMHGFAFETPFTIICSDWDSNYAPLEYSFELVRESMAGQSVRITSPQQSSSASALLPAGDFTLVAFVSDIFGSVSQLNVSTLRVSFFILRLFILSLSF